MDLSTSYLGISLKNPIVPSASPLSRDLDKAKALEDRGAAALVMNSLFEEEIEHEASSMDFLMQGQSLGHGEADSYLPMHGEYQSCLEKYLEQLVSLKACLDIPVIASLNGITDGGWTDYAKDLEAAGADALELNIYYIPVDISESADTVEERHIRILQAVKQQVSIPVTCKDRPAFQLARPFYQAARGCRGERCIAVQSLLSAGYQYRHAEHRFQPETVGPGRMPAAHALDSNCARPCESVTGRHWRHSRRTIRSQTIAGWCGCHPHVFGVTQIRPGSCGCSYRGVDPLDGRA